MTCPFELLDEGIRGRVEIRRGCGCVATTSPSMRIDSTGFAHLASMTGRAHVLIDREDDASLVPEPRYGEVTRGQA
jgi:hypothetical protein